MVRRKAFSATYKAMDEATGVFEALVAVFNNVDRGGDKILPGAFKNTLGAWEEKGRPIPVVFAHQWDNLDAHVGYVLEAKETDEGLRVKGQLEMDEPYAQRVWKKMKKGLLAEFSFAYDVVEGGFVEKTEEGTKQHYYELRELDLLEVGPCLVGMNPETELIAVKQYGVDVVDLQRQVRELTEKVKMLSGGEGEGSGQDEAGPGDAGSGKARSPGTSTIDDEMARSMAQEVSQIRKNLEATNVQTNG